MSVPLAKFHMCHAYGCTSHCPPRHLMCRACWTRVPAELQRAVVETFGAGHPKRADGVIRPTKDWFDAVRAAKASLR